MIKNSKYTSVQIAKAVDGTLIGSNDVIECLTTDSREKTIKNSCFFALKGKNYNGTDYVNEAINNGAKLIVTDKYSDSCKNASQIIVKDVSVALGLLGKHHKGKTKVIGVTGSVGKTSVKELVKCVLSEKYKVCASFANNNNEIGVSKTLLAITDEDFCICEMGMRKRGDIEYLSFLCEPDTSIITNSYSSHIELLGSFENIFRAKTEILLYTKKNAVVPCENRFRDLNYNGINPYFIGEGGDCFVNSIKYGSEGIGFEVMGKGMSNSYFIYSFGIHNVYNSLFAIKVGQIYGLTYNEILRGLMKFKGEKLRDTFLEINNVIFIEDCYNASFEGMKSALLSLAKYAEQKRLTPHAVLGDMLEIGDYSPEYHFRIGEYARDLNIKSITAIGRYAQSVIDGYKGGEIANDVKEASERIRESRKKGDIVLLKASRALKFENIINYLKEN